MKTKRLIALLLLAALSACGESGSDSADSDCTTLVKFEGRTYVETGEIVDQPSGAEPTQIGTGTLPDCDDTGDGAGPSSTASVAAFLNVAPDQAVLVRYAELGASAYALFVIDGLDEKSTASLVAAFEEQQRE